MTYCDWAYLRTSVFWFADGKFPDWKQVIQQQKRKKKQTLFSACLSSSGRIGVTLERTLIYYIFLTALWNFCGSPRVQTCWPTLRLILLEHWRAQRKCQRVFSWLLAGIQALSINHSYNDLNGFQLLMGARSGKASSDTGNDSKRRGGNEGMLWIVSGNIVERMWSVTQLRKHDVQQEGMRVSEAFWVQWTEEKSMEVSHFGF